MPDLLTKEEYLKAYDYMYPQRETFGNSSFKENFSVKAMIVINDIEENAKEFNDAKWHFIANEFKDNHDIMVAVLKSGCAPTDVVHKIIENTKMVKENITDYMKISQEDIKIASTAMYNAISEKDMETIKKHLGKNMVKMHSFNTSYGKDYNDRVHPNAINFMAKSLAESYDPPVRAYYHDSDGLAVIFFVRDEKVIKEISDIPDVHEDVRSACINNPYISDELRNEIFQMGCNMELIEKFTPEILDEVYRSAVEALEVGFDATEKELRSAHFMSKSFLYSLVAKRVLTEAMEIDLANIVLEQSDKSMDNLRHQIFYCTKSPRVLELAERIKGKDKLVAYENPNMPEHMLKARVDKMMKTMRKNIELKKPNKTPDAWFEYLRKYVHQIELTKEDYATLINHSSDSHLIIAIAISPKTPEEVLKEIIEKPEVNRYISPRVAVAARLNLDCNVLPQNVKDHIMHFCREINPHSYELERYMKDPEQNSSRSALHLRYATQSLEAAVREADEKTFNELMSILNNNKSKETKKDSIIMYDYMIHILEKEMLKKQHKDQFKETKSIEGLNEEELKNILLNMQGNDWNFNNVSRYVSLYHNANDALVVGAKWQEMKEAREKLEEIAKSSEVDK